MAKRGVLTLWVGLCLIFVMMTATVPIAYGEKAPEPIRLTMISAYPLANITINYATTLFKKYVEAWSNGRIIIDFKGGPEIVAFSEIPKVTERGMFDIAFTAPPYVGSQYPAFQLFNFLTPANQRIAQRDEKLWELMSKITRNHGMVYLGAWQGGNPNFTLMSKQPPLDKEGKIASFKGLKIRTGGPFDADFVSDLGGTPVAMHPGEVYEGLRTKLIDGTMTPMNAALLSRFWEIITCMSKDVVYTFNGMAFINANRFDKLPPEARKLIIDVAKEVQTVSYNYTGAITWDGIGSEAGYAKVPMLSFNDTVKKTMAATRRKKLDIFAAAEPKLSKEIVEAFAGYYGVGHMSLSTDLSLKR